MRVTVIPPRGHGADAGGCAPVAELGLPSAIAAAFNEKNLDVVGQSVDQGDGARGVAKDGVPAPEWQVGGDQQGAVLVAAATNRPRPNPELRAATPAPSTGQGATLTPIQPFIFAPSIAPRLGIDMPSAPSGSYSEMTISTALPAARKAKGGDADDTAGALTPVTANPRRISARMSVTLEDVARIGQANFEAALRSNVSMALSDEYDDQCINGNSTSPNIIGLVKQLDDPTNPTAVAGFDAFVAALAGAIDGLWASTMRDIAIVGNVAAYKLSAKTFRDRVIDTGQRGGVSLGDVSFADYAQTHTGGWWTNKRMPATASTIARGIVYRM